MQKVFGSGDAPSIYETLIEQIKDISTDDLLDSDDEDIQMKIIEKQKVYFWIRLFLKEELDDLEVGDDFEICYRLSGETLKTKFIAFGKKNLNRDLDNEVISYDREDDNSVLTLMVDSDDLEKSDIPFIRTLFKTSPYYQFQVYRRSDLTFTNNRNQQEVEYIDCQF